MNLKIHTNNFSNTLFFFPFPLAFPNFFVSLPRQAEKNRPGQRKRILRFVPDSENFTPYLFYHIHAAHGQGHKAMIGSLSPTIRKGSVLWNTC